MKIAIATIAPDARQRALLKIAWPTWERYARRLDLPIVVIERSRHPEHPYWGKYFSLTEPELAGFDAVLALDNDILINPESPSILEIWGGDRVAIADERAQFDWNDEYTARYYAGYELSIPPPPARLGILNTGVILYTRAHLALFASAHARWIEWREQAGEAKRQANAFAYANDQPHISLALQAAEQVQELPPKFNRLWWSWYRERGRVHWRVFQAYAKASSILEEFAPASLADFFARPGAHALQAAVNDCHFLHVAGSKSPIWLYAHRPSP